VLAKYGHLIIMSVEKPFSCYKLLLYMYDRIAYVYACIDIAFPSSVFVM